MNGDLIVTAYVVIDTVMRALGHRSHRLAQVSDAEVLTYAGNLVLRSRVSRALR